MLLDQVDTVELFAAIKNVRDFSIADVIPLFFVNHFIDGVDVILLNKDLHPSERAKELLGGQQTVIVGVVGLKGAHEAELATGLLELVSNSG